MLGKCPLLQASSQTQTLHLDFVSSRLSSLIFFCCAVLNCELSGGEAEAVTLGSSDWKMGRFFFFILSAKGDSMFVFRCT